MNYKDLSKHLFLTLAILLLGVLSYGQQISPSGNTNQVLVNYGSNKVGRLLILPRTFLPFATYDSTGSIWVDSASTKRLWFHNGISRRQMVDKAYTDSAVASVSGGGDSIIYVTQYQNDTGKANIYSAIAQVTIDTATIYTTIADSAAAGRAYTDNAVAGVTIDTTAIYAAIDGKLDTTISAFANKFNQIATEPGSIVYFDGMNVVQLPANETSNAQYLTAINGILSYAPISIPGFLTYYLHDMASDIASALQMTNEIATTTEQYISVASPVDGDTIQSWATNMGLPNLAFIPAGTSNVHFHAFRSGGDLSSNVQIFADIYKVDTNGLETLIIETDPSSNLSSIEQEWSVSATNAQAEAMNRSDRIIMYIRVAVSGAGITPTVNIGFCGTTNARIELPTPAVDASNFLPYTGAVHDLNMGAKMVTADSFISFTPLVYVNQFLDSILATKALIPTDNNQLTNGAGYITNSDITGKVNYTDTATMLAVYLRKLDTATLSARINLKVNFSDTGSMLSVYLRKLDTSSLSNRINLKVNFTDTANMLASYLRKLDTASLSNRINAKGVGSVTSVAAANAFAITWSGSPITGTGTLTPTVDTGSAGLCTRWYRQKAIDSLNAVIATKGAGTVTSIIGGGYMLGGTVTATGTLTPDTAANKLATKTDLTSGTYTLTNKRITFRVNSDSASYTTSVTMNSDNYDTYKITAQTGALLFNAPSGAPTESQMLLVRIKDNGTARALTWNSIFRAGTDASLPTTTTLSKTMYIEFLYNFTDTKWDVVGVANGY